LLGLAKSIDKSKFVIHCIANLKTKGLVGNLYPITQKGYEKQIAHSCGCGRYFLCGLRSQEKIHGTF
jgi:enoyl-[acyl-carrier-protein] reductase (NADH)